MTKREDLSPKICPICNTAFIIKPKEKPSQFLRRKYCGNPCKMKGVTNGNRGKKAHNNQQMPRTCIWCGKTKMVAPAYSDRKYCDVKCMQRHYASGIQRGENHWHWMGGITEDKGRDSLYPGYKEWRREVYGRDGFKCVNCGCNKSGSLQAHHIVPVCVNKSLLLDIDNGLTLCIDCHKKVHYG